MQPFLYIQSCMYHTVNRWQSTSYGRLLSRLRLGKVKLMPPHIYAHAPEGYAFHFQAESLFGAVFSGKFDGSAGADDALPGESGNLAEDADDLAGGSGPACGVGDGSIGGDGSWGQGANATGDLGGSVGGLILTIIFLLILLGALFLFGLWLGHGRRGGSAKV